MKRPSQIFILFLVAFTGHSQNLVPNWSFEDTLHCPTDQNQVYNCPPWYNPTSNTPDYFNSCYSGPGPFRPDVPSNFWGYQFAHTGNAYCGVSSYEGYASRNLRDYIAVRLTNSLVINKRYCVSFYVNLSTYSIYSIDAIGIFFSQDSIYSTTIFNLPLSPQISNSTGNIISDTLNWTLISGSFIADSAYKYITIGNFKDDANTNMDSTSTTSTPGVAYYYIDDVSVFMCDSTSNLANVPNVFTPNNDGVNDVFEIKGTNLKDFKLSIYNRWGTKVYDFISPNDAWDGYTTTGEACSEGVYFYFLTAKGEDGKDYERKGCLQLLR